MREGKAVLFFLLVFFWVSLAFLPSRVFGALEKGGGGSSCTEIIDWYSMGPWLGPLIRVEKQNKEVLRLKVLRRFFPEATREERGPVNGNVVGLLGRAYYAFWYTEGSFYRADVDFSGMLFNKEEEKMFVWNEPSAIGLGLPFPGRAQEFFPVRHTIFGPNGKIYEEIKGIAGLVDFTRIFLKEENLMRMLEEDPQGEVWDRFLEQKLPDFEGRLLTEGALRERKYTYYAKRALKYALHVMTKKEFLELHWLMEGELQELVLFFHGIEEENRRAYGDILRQRAGPGGLLQGVGSPWSQYQPRMPLAAAGSDHRKRRWFWRMLFGIYGDKEPGAWPPQGKLSKASIFRGEGEIPFRIDDEFP